MPSSCAVLADLQSVHWFHGYDNTHIILLCKLIALYAANVYSTHGISASACTSSRLGSLAAVLEFPSVL